MAQLFLVLYYIAQLQHRQPLGDCWLRLDTEGRNQVLVCIDPDGLYTACTPILTHSGQNNNRAQLLCFSEVTPSGVH